MSRSRIFTRLVLLSAMAFSLGCANQTSPTSLAAMQADSSRQLAMACYWENDGLRLVAGPAAAFSACRKWADGVTRVRYPKSNTASSFSAAAQR